LIGQWLSDIAGLGDLFEPEKVLSALKSIFKYNWRSDLSDHENCQRIYALGKEAGLLLCTWPRSTPPKFPFFYCDEVWSGIECQVASHMIRRGLVKEGVKIVKAVRDRHDGVKRNPWNEVECGHHYARSMASWALLLSFSGFHYNALKGYLSFAPAVNKRNFRCFFATGTSWGKFGQKISSSGAIIRIENIYGKLRLARLELAGLPYVRTFQSVLARIGRKPVQTTIEKRPGAFALNFLPILEMGPATALNIKLMSVK